MRKTAIAVLLSGVLSAGAAFAAPNEEGDSYSGGSPAFQTAATLVKSGQFDKALPRLEALAVAESDNADVFNLLGFSRRKTGDLEGAGAAYARALALEPRHIGALEYQGELFLMLDDVAGAEANLEKLDGICWLGCDAERELKAAIAKWKAARGS